VASIVWKIVGGLGRSGEPTGRVAHVLSIAVAQAGQYLRHHRRNSERFCVALAAEKEGAEHVGEIVSYLVIYHELLGAFLGVKA